MGGKFKVRKKASTTSHRSRIGGKAKKIKASRRQGVTLQNRWEPHLRKRFKYVFKLVDVEGARVPREPTPGPSSKRPPPRTWPPAAEADFLVGDSLDDLLIVDSKKTPKSGFQTNQKKAYPAINERGGEVVTRKSQQNLVTGQYHDLGGVPLQRQRLLILYEVDLVAIEAGQISLDGVINDGRIGKLEPKPTSLQLPPADISGLERRMTSNRGTGEGNRGLSQLEPDTSGGSMAKTGTPAAGTSSPGSDVPRIKGSAGKKILRFTRGFLIDTLVSLAIAFVVMYFERKVREDITRLMNNFWRKDIAPRVLSYINDRVELSMNGRWVLDEASLGRPNPRQVYVRYEWTLMLRELREDMHDVIVWGLKFLPDPGFGEVYHGVRLDRIYTWVPRGGEEAKDRTLGSPYENRRVKGVNNYEFVNFVLVHDSHVLSMARSMHRSTALIRSKFDGILRQWDRAHVSIPPSDDLVSQIRKDIDYYDLVHQVRKTIDHCQFAKASGMMDQLAQTMDQNSSVSTKSLKELSTSTFRIAQAYKVKYENKSRKQRDLLHAYLGVPIDLQVPYFHRYAPFWPGSWQPDAQD